MHFGNGKLFYEENREMFLIPGKSSLYRKNSLYRGSYYEGSTVYPAAHTVQWLVTLAAVPLGLGLNPAGGNDVCKCIMPPRHDGTLNSRRDASPLVRLVEGEERSGSPRLHIQCVLPQNWNRIEQNRTASCSKLRLTTGVNVVLCRNVFRGP
ncbi:uncharacterized protein TNCV_3479531 [Trichonephila clavipes]|nr:uncharacterized protein TNCV_3479531 [Trichonephila clavipes]